MVQLEQVLKDVRMGVQDMMERTVINGDTDFHYEQRFGTAYVDIDFCETCSCGYVTGNITVHVSHEDGRKCSPLLEKAIRSVLPKWFDVKDEILQSA